MAPGHHFDRTTLKALSDLNFRYITDGHAFFPYKMKELNLTFIPQLFARPHGFSFGIYTTCCHIDHMNQDEIDIFLEKTTSFDILPFSDAFNVAHPYGAKNLSILTAKLLINLNRLFVKIKRRLKN